jgi:hypothetical protein
MPDRTLALLALSLSLAAQPVAAAPAPKPAPARPVAGARARAATPARRVLPDSVVLRIDGREDLTLRRFERAVRLLGGRPDSLTPADRDRFLDLVTEQRLLAARALRDPRPWARADSQMFASERDNILLRAALSDRFEALEARRRSLGQPDLDEQGMGVAARESLMIELRPQWDSDLLRKVGSYFAELPRPTANMSPREQIAMAAMVPKVPAADSAKVLVRTSLGPFTVAELLADWRRLSSIYRPHVEDEDGVKALVQNSLFERVIRRAAADPALAKRPIVAAVIADRVEYHSVTTFLQRELLSTIPTDSVALLRHFRAHRSEFDRMPRASIVVLTLENLRAADSLARLFTVAGEAESLAFRAQRSGVRYTLMVTEASDSALFHQAVRTGAGGVTPPHQVEGGGWRVFKVLALEPRTPQEFTAVREDVLRSWNEQESERRIRALLDRLKREAKLERNEAALRAMVTRRASSGGGS